MTKKESFSDSFLKSLVGHKNFSWNHLPSKGSAAGILPSLMLFLGTLGISLSLVWLKYKLTGVKFRVIIVYGSPYEEEKDEFLYVIVCS